MFEGQRKKAAAGKDAGGFFPEGNKFWKNRTVSGRPRLFGSPEELEAAAFEYFDWVDDNPLFETKVFGTGLVAKVPLARAMTIKSMCIHVGMSHRSWIDYKARPEFEDVCDLISEIIYEQKFAGAAAGLFSAAIIARDLGLADKSEVETSVTVEVIDSYDENNDTE